MAVPGAWLTPEPVVRSRGQIGLCGIPLQEQLSCPVRVEEQSRGLGAGRHWNVLDPGRDGGYRGVDVEMMHLGVHIKFLSFIPVT